MWGVSVCICACVCVWIVKSYERINGTGSDNSIGENLTVTKRRMCRD